jgi:hypothetical protein
LGAAAISEQMISFELPAMSLRNQAVRTGPTVNASFGYSGLG